MNSIYGVLNPKSKKYYIGKTKNTLSKRKYQHNCAAKRKTKPNKFYDCLLKEGNNLIWFIIEYGISDDDINNKEIYYISFYDSYNNGYNGTLGGTGGNTWLGGKNDNERKIKCKERMLGENNPNYGKNMSDDAKDKMIKSKIGSHIHSENNKKNISVRLKSEWDNGDRKLNFTDENRFNWSGKNLSDGHKKSIGESLKKSAKYKEGRLRSKITRGIKFLKKLKIFNDLVSSSKTKLEIMNSMNIKESTYYKYKRLNAIGVI